MAPLDDMSAPGTATYDSETMTVGDGTWDFTKNDFLLPNLVGLNLETTQYNGMLKIPHNNSKSIIILQPSNRSYTDLVFS